MQNNYTDILRLVNYRFIPRRHLVKFTQRRDSIEEGFDFSARSTSKNSYSFGFLTAGFHPEDGRKIFNIDVAYLSKSYSEKIMTHKKFIEVAETEEEYWETLNKQKDTNKKTIIPVSLHSKKNNSADFYIPSLEEIKDANTFEFGIERYLLWKIDKINFSANIKPLDFEEDMKKFLNYLSLKRKSGYNVVFNNLLVIDALIDALKSTDSSYSLPVYKEISIIISNDLDNIYHLLGLPKPERFKYHFTAFKLEEMQLVPFNLRDKTSNKKIISLCDKFDEFYSDFIRLSQKYSLRFKFFGDRGQSYRNKKVFSDLSLLIKETLPTLSIIALFINIFWIFISLEGDINFFASIAGFIDISSIGPIFTIACVITLFVLTTIILFYILVSLASKLISIISKYINFFNRVIPNKISAGLIVLLIVVIIIVPLSGSAGILLPTFMLITLAIYINVCKFSILEIYRFSKSLSIIIFSAFIIIPTTTLIAQNNVIPGQSCVIFKKSNKSGEKIIYYKYLTAGNWSDSTDIVLLPGSTETLPNGEKYKSPAVINVKKNDLPPTITCPPNFNNQNIENSPQYYIKKEDGSFSWVDSNSR